MEHEKILIKGRSVSPGIVTGYVKILKNYSDINKVNNGDIIVVKNSNPAFAIGVMKSSGLICERSGMQSHLCIITMEMELPCIVDAERATELLEDNLLITLDATSGIIYKRRHRND